MHRQKWRKRGVGESPLFVALKPVAFFLAKGAKANTDAWVSNALGNEKFYVDWRGQSTDHRIRSLWHCRWTQFERWRSGLRRRTTWRLWMWSLAAPESRGCCGYSWRRTQSNGSGWRNGRRRARLKICLKAFRWSCSRV